MLNNLQKFINNLFENELQNDELLPPLDYHIIQYIYIKIVEDETFHIKACKSFSLVSKLFHKVVEETTVAYRIPCSKSSVFVTSQLLLQLSFVFTKYSTQKIYWASTPPMIQVALLYACEEGFDKIIPILIQQGADLNTFTFDKSPLFAAVDFSRLTVLKTLLQQEEIDINAQNSRGISAFMLSYLKDNLEFAQAFLNNENTNINLKNRENFTTLMLGCQYNKPKFVKLLLDTQDKLDLNLKNNNGDSALHLAVHQNTELLDIILNSQFVSNLDINIQDDYGYTVLIRICFKGNTSALKILLSKKKSLNLDLNIQTNNGYTALMWTIIEQNYDCFNILFPHSEIDVNLKNFEGKSVMDYAAESNNNKILNLLQTKK